MRVLIIAEDPTQDYYILEPIVKAMLEELGRPRAIVRTCRDPVYRGISEVLKPKVLEEILHRYPMVDLFLLCVDRDGEAGRRAQLDAREQGCLERLESGRRTFIAEHAWQEVEVWALAGCSDLPPEWPWREIRAERDPKERYFNPYVQMRRLVDTPGAGRQALGRQAGRQYAARLRQRCPEDIAALEGRVRAWLAAR